MEQPQSPLPPGGQGPGQVQGAAHPAAGQPPQVLDVSDQLAGGGQLRLLRAHCLGRGRGRGERRREGGNSQSEPSITLTDQSQLS